MSSRDRRRKRRRSSSPFEERQRFKDFYKHRRKLNKIFFRDEDFIQEGSGEYKDFWNFLSRYQNYQKQKNYFVVEKLMIMVKLLLTGNHYKMSLLMRKEGIEERKEAGKCSQN